MEPERDIPIDIDYKLLTIIDKSLIDESNLVAKTKEAAQHFINQVFQFPILKSEDGPQISLVDNIPSRSMSHSVSIALPRFKPVPKGKVLTRWEKFAKEKGIQKKKTSRYDYNVQRNEFTLNHATKDWLLEVPKNIDQDTDMFEAQSEEKRTKREKNKMQQRRNQQEIANGGVLSKEARKAQVVSQVKQVKVATASMGKFDKAVKNENVVKTKGLKRKFESNEIPVEKEKDSQLKMAKMVTDVNYKPNKVSTGRAIKYAQQPKRR